MIVDWFTQYPFHPENGMPPCKAKRVSKTLAATVPKRGTQARCGGQTLDCAVSFGEQAVMGALGFPDSAPVTHN